MTTDELRARFEEWYADTPKDIQPIDCFEFGRASREGEVEALRTRIEGAPIAIMDTRDALGLCAPTEADFPALYALQGKRVRLVVEE